MDIYNLNMVYSVCHEVCNAQKEPIKNNYKRSI